MTLTAKMSVRCSALQENPLDLVTGTARLLFEPEFSLADGTGANQADQSFSDQYTLAASGTQVVDLSAIANGVGQDIKFTTVKAILVRLRDATGSTASAITVAPNTTEGFADWISGTTPAVEIPNGGIMLVSAPKNGWGVTENSDDKLLITNSDGSNAAIVDVVVLGVATVV